MSQNTEQTHWGPESFQRWPIPPRTLFHPALLAFAEAILSHRDETPFAINMPSELYLDIKKTQKFRDAMPDVDLANMTGDNFNDNDIPWPDYRTVKNPPISVNQLDSIGYNIDLTDSELTGPIKGPAMSDEDFIFQKLDLAHRRLPDEPMNHIAMGISEQKFYSGREQSFSSAFRAGESEDIPEWTHRGFNNFENEYAIENDRDGINEAFEDYDKTYRENLLNSDLKPDPPKVPGAMTKWYRKGPVGRGPKPPPKISKDLTDRLAEDYRWLLQDGDQDKGKGKDKGDVEMGGTSGSGGLDKNAASMGDIGGRSAANDAPGPSGYNSGPRSEATLISTREITKSNASGPAGYNSGANLRAAPVNTPKASNAPGSSGFNPGAGERSGVGSAAGPSGYKSAPFSRNTVSMGGRGSTLSVAPGSPGHDPEHSTHSASKATSAYVDPSANRSGAPSNYKTTTVKEHQSRGLTHQHTIDTGAATKTPTKKQEYSMKNPFIANAATKRAIARGSEDEDWVPENKPKGVKRVATPKSLTPKSKKPKDMTPKAVVTKAAVPNPFKPTAPKAKNPKAAGPKTAAPKFATPKSATPKSATPKTATPKTATPKTATPKTATPKTATPKTATPKSVTSKAGTPKSSTPKPTAPKPTRKSSLKKSVSEESPDGNWEPDDEDMYDA